jgi:dihydroorotate dehydrogenase electron transfer subunit
MSVAPRSLSVMPLLRRESIGDAYHILTFEAPAPVDAAAGQFVMVRGAEWGDAPLLPRPMSYLNAGTTPAILIKVMGEGTTRMARAEPGEPFALLGPLGIPWRAHSPDRTPVLVAGGVGVAPLVFLAQRLRQAGVKPIAIYGGRTAKDLPLDDLLAEICDLRITTEDGSRGRKGRVTDELEVLLAAGMEVFTCGPDRMMAAVAALAASRDIPCEVSLETPMACGYGVCLGCPVKSTDDGYLYACTEGPCVNARRVDWATGGHAPVRAPGAKP